MSDPSPMSMSGSQPGLKLAWRFALRELRGGIRGFRVFLLCLIMGVAAIAAVGSLSNAIEAGLARDAQKLLGGDADLRLTHNPAPSEQIEWLSSNSVDMSRVDVMRAMAVREDREASRLIEVKAIDARYPLYGQFDVTNSQFAGPGLHDFLGVNETGFPGAVVGSGLMTRLQLEIGDRFRLGDQLFEIRDVIVNEPDRSTQAFELGPRVIITHDALEQTGLILPGSLIRYHYRLKLDAETADDLMVWRNDLEEAFPKGGWRIRDRLNAAPNIQRFIDRVGMFLTLVGLTALLVGGVGIGNAIRAYIQARVGAIATLKCLGAQSNMILQMAFIQIGLLAILGIAIGMIVGAVGPILVADLLSARLPIQVVIGFHPLPLILAALFGLLVTLIFAIPPLDQTRTIKPASLFRRGQMVFGGIPSLKAIAAVLLTIGFLVFVALLAARDERLAAGFLVGAIGTLLIFRMAASLVTWLAAKMPRFGPVVLRMGLANLHRPGAATSSVVMSLGLGLTVLVAVALVESNMNRQVTDVLSGEAPGFYFIDVQNDQVDEFRKTLDGFEGMDHTESVPMLRGTIEALAGVPVEEIDPPSEEAWILRGDRGITWSATAPRSGAEIVEGEWWPEDYNDPDRLLVSFDEEAARAFGLGIGDTITINVMGLVMEAEIYNLRYIDWNNLGINFVMIFSPGMLDNAPQTHIFTAYLDPENEAALERQVVKAFPNVSSIWVKEVLEGVAQILANVGVAVRSIAAIAIVAGILVLAGALAAEHERRIQDSVILKVLGATRSRIFMIFLTEYGLMGAITAAIALGVGALASFVVIEFIMEAEWVFDPMMALLTIGLAMGITLFAGFVGTFGALSAKTAPHLRND